jgi:hypothetical protein
MLRIVLPVIAVSLCLEGCMRPIPKTAGGSVGTPRVGWVVMMGDRDNPDREFVCYSESAGDCVMPPSRPNDQVFAHVHLFYHPAATETKYTGTVQIGFFNSALDLRPNFTVKPGTSPGNQSVVGIVSGKPGTYPLRIEVDATPAPADATRQIREQVMVTVR